MIPITEKINLGDKIRRGNEIGYVDTVSLWFTWTALFNGRRRYGHHLCLEATKLKHTSMLWRGVPILDSTGRSIELGARVLYDKHEYIVAGLCLASKRVHFSACHNGVGGVPAAAVTLTSPKWTLP